MKKTTAEEIREEFEHNLRTVNDKKSTNDLIMTWFDQAVDQITSKRVAEALEEVERELNRKLDDYDMSTDRYIERCTVYDCIKIVEKSKPNT